MGRTEEAPAGSIRLFQSQVAIGERHSDLGNIFCPKNGGDVMIKNCMKRNVFSIHSSATIRQAATLVVERHIGLLPVVDDADKLVGAVRLRDLLSLELPDFYNLLPDLDFVHDFGAVETTRPSPQELDRPITTLMHPAAFVEETCGLLRAYALMMKHNFHDLLVVSENGALVGIASRVDIAVAILSTWKTVTPT